MSRSIWLSTIGCILVFADLGFAQHDVRGDEEFLRTQLKIQTDNANLIKLLTKRAECENAAGLDKLVCQLGSVSYAEREATTKLLILFGHVTLPGLNKRSTGPDVELRQRAQECVKAIESEAGFDWIGPTIRMLHARKAPGAIEAILAVLPCAKDPRLEEEIYYAIDGLCPAEKPLPDCLLRVLEDANPERRAIAACIIGRRGDAKQQGTIRALLQKEQNDHVRLRGAQGLLAASDKGAIPVLIDLLRSSSGAACFQAEELLRWSVRADSPSVLLGSSTDPDKSKRECHAAWRAWWQRKGDKYRLDPAFAQSGGPCLVLAWGGNLNYLVGSDGSIRREMFTNVNPIMLADVLPEGHVLTMHWTHPGVGTWVLVRDMFGARLWQFYIQMNPDSWKRLGNDEWEFKCRWSFLVCDTNGKVIRSKKYDINSVAGSRNEVSLLRDGSKLTSVFDVYNTELGTCLSRVFPDGRVVWEAFLPYSNINRAVEVFPLVRFGFSAKGQIDTLEDRLRMLQSGNVLLRRHGVIKLKAFPMDDTVFAALVKSLRDPDEFVRHQALPLVRRSPERCKEAISDFARLLNEPYAPSLAPVYDAMGPEKSIPVLLKAFKDSSSPNADRRRCNAIWLLGRLYIGHDDQVTEVLRASINSQDKVLKIQAMASVAGHPKAKVLLKEVINAIDDPDKDVARGAIGSLSHLGSNANPAIPALLKAMERPEVRGHVVGTFKFVGIDDPQVLKKLIDCLGEEESPEIVADAAGALARRGKQAKDAVKPLIKLLNNKWSGIIGFQAQANAACALGAIGPDAKEALEPLVRIVSTGSRIPVNYDVLIHAIGGIDPATRIELIKRETRFPKNKVPEIDPQIKQLPRIKL